jgi:hypothetical protein
VGIAHHLNYRFDMNIEMKIFDVFHLSFGYSVFVGKFMGEEPRRINNNYTANLIVDGNVCLEDIPIGGRMMGISPDGQIGIGTVAIVDVTSDFIRDRDCSLLFREIEIPQPMPLS